MTAADKGHLSTQIRPHPRPRAVILSPGAEAGSIKRSDALTADEPILHEPEQDSAQLAQASQRRFSWGRLFIAGLGGFLSLALWLWAERVLRDLLNQSPALGMVAAGLLALAMLALLVLVGRLVRDLLRMRKVEALRLRVVIAATQNDLAAAQAVAQDVISLVATIPATARGRAALARALPELTAAVDVIALTEREILKPLDDIAAAQVARAARQVSVVTAVSPRAIVDVGFVLFACLRLLRDVAGTYGARPGWLGLMKLARATLVHLMVTGGMAAGDALLQQLMGQGLAAKLSAKLGEGVLNGLLTARIGLSAIAQCRPMPFVEETAPALKDVAGELFSRKDSKADI